MNSEAARATNAEISLGNQVNSEIARVQGAESALTAALNTEITRALAGEIAPRQGATISVETSLTTLANTFANPTDFVFQVAHANFP